MADLVPRPTWPANLGSVADLWIVLSDLVCVHLAESPKKRIPQLWALPLSPLNPPGMLQGPFQFLLPRCLWSPEARTLESFLFSINTYALE